MSPLTSQTRTSPNVGSERQVDGPPDDYPENAGWLAFNTERIRVRNYSSVVKRCLDLVVLSVASPIWVPLLLLIAGALKLLSPGSVFFRQRRIGLDGVPFNVLKFRTMRIDAELYLAEMLQSNEALAEEWRRHHKLRNDPRITSLGRVLRATSLDELPQLINVLRGEMSLVGPRPLPAYHLFEAPEEFVFARQSVLPGLTGLWQVKTRDGEMGHLIRYDSEYLADRGVLQDLKLILATAWAVVCGRGK